jgi:predicted lipase
VQDSINDWTCHACKAFPHVTATTFHGKIKDANGFVAYDSAANEIIVSFSGTDPFSIQNWIDDLDFVHTPYAYCSGCEVHEGFLKSFNSVVDQVKSLVNSTRTAHPSAKISVTGHSLGAAMAALCTAELVHSGYKISASYTFGMPRVGNEAFATWYKSSSGIPGTYRVVHDHDPVPHVPLSAMDFHHMPYETFYKHDYKTWQLCNFEGEDKSCSNQFLTDLNVG